MRPSSTRARTRRQSARGTTGPKGTGPGGRSKRFCRLHSLPGADEDRVWFLWAKEDLTKLALELLELFHSRIVHKNHVGRYFFRVFEGRVNARGENKLPGLCNSFLTLG